MKMGFKINEGMSHVNIFFPLKQEIKKVFKISWKLSFSLDF